ncbi:CAAX amino protease [Enterococcus saigonensis]|uniref:CAAX amino protease n=1 Tax=Enterococcus saigonensis TaxID=1805431 RepID=A0A679IM43_9ENTE|nr:type II CAAX endopeptidase family protein [Enterococcus saigonensis]BCA86356.1 CAAX amino protease [Enterococcus saigonensis]
MSQIKYSFLSVLCYALIFFIPDMIKLHNGTTLTASLSYLIGTGILIILYQKVRPLSFESKSVSPKKDLLISFIGILSIILLVGVGGYIETFFSFQNNFNRGLNMLDVLWQRPIFAMIATICGPIIEEFVFRRACIGFFSEYFSLRFAILFSATAFALVHVDSDIFIYFILGYVLSLLYVKSGSLKTAIISHCGSNILVLAIQVLRFAT